MVLVIQLDLLLLTCPCLNALSGEIKFIYLVINYD